MGNAENVEGLVGWMGHVERHVASIRSGLEGVTGKPRIIPLFRMQGDHRRMLAALTSTYWAQDPGDRTALLPAYLQALITFKVIADDLYVETLEEALQPKNKTDPKSPRGPIDKRYHLTIEDWIIGSPLLDPNTHKNNRKVIPTVENHISTPSRRKRPIFLDQTKKLRATVAAAATGDLQRISGNPNADSRLSASTDHLLGVLFVLAQLELYLRWENDQTLQNDVQSWYEAALLPIKLMADDIFGVCDEAIRTAILTLDDPLTEHLVTMRQFMIIDLATRYSLRRHETRLLLSFFEKENVRGPFAYQDIAIGINKVKETLFAYIGKPNPDKQGGRDAKSVTTIRALEADLIDTDVRVFGLANKSVTRLTDELTKKSLVILDADLMGKPFTIGANRRVIVDGTLTGSGKTLAIDPTRIVPHSEGYRALVGFPLRFAQVDATGALLEQQPPFRRTTAALQRIAILEQRDDEEGVFSVPQTVAGQRELISDLLRYDGIRTGFASTLAKTTHLDLQDQEVRAKAWSILFKDMVKDGNRDAMRGIGGFVGSYFAHYTRHTYYNLRDKGKSYLDSAWPTDLTNRKLHDCGVYAVQAAYDFYRAVAGVSGIKLEFRFLTFLNHLCLIVFFDDQSFLVNNARVHQPEPFRFGTTLNEKQGIAAMDWGGQAFTTVYDVSYTMFLAVLPRISKDTHHTDAEFRKQIFQLFLDSLGWGIKNDSLIAGKYFTDIDRFDASSRKLADMLPVLKSGKASAVEWNAATTLALDLYALGEAITDFGNFSFDPKFANKRPIPGIGFAIDRDLIEAGVRTLPMYEVGALVAEGKTGRPLTSDQDVLSRKNRDAAHANELTSKFQQIAAAPPKKKP